MASGTYQDGHMAKRQRTESAGRSYEDRHHPDPSPVVHVRNISGNAMEHDIVTALKHFGPIVYVTMMPNKRQALVEFEDLNGSSSCVKFSADNQLYIAGQPAYFNYSTSQQIKRPQGSDIDMSGPYSGGNHILLFTIQNPHYPITVDVMHTICSSYGTVLRIVIFKKFALQSMVEFDSIESAKRAKQSLNGADVYSGCCTLRIEYAKPTKLNVMRNDVNESWDYTKTGQAAEERIEKAPLLQDPRFTAAPTPYSGGEDNFAPRQQHQNNFGGNQMFDQGSQGQGDSFDSGFGMRSGGMGQSRGGGMGQSRGGAGLMGQGFGTMSPQRSFGGSETGRGGGGFGGSRGGSMGDSFGGGYSQGGGSSYGMDQGSGGGGGQQGTVLMVYGLNMDKMNCDRVFNIFCLYGNVHRIKFLKSKEGSCMVQMGDNVSMERAIYNLSGSIFFGSKMNLSVSKQLVLQEVQNPYELQDSSDSYKDYSGNRLNRFFSPEAASKNRIMNPTEILHFFNAPANITIDEVVEVFTNLGAPAPKRKMMFPPKETGKSSSGLMEMENKADAMEALVLVNHTSVPNPAGGRPYTMKLCFSQTIIHD